MPQAAGAPTARPRSPLTARELRFAFVFDDYDAALHLFRDVFGLRTLKVLDPQGGRGVILRIPVKP